MAQLSRSRAGGGRPPRSRELAVRRPLALAADRAARSITSRGREVTRPLQPGERVLYEDRRAGRAPFVRVRVEARRLQMTTYAPPTRASLADGNRGFDRARCAGVSDQEAPARSSTAPGASHGPSRLARSGRLMIRERTRSGCYSTWLDGSVPRPPVVRGATACPLVLDTCRAHGHAGPDASDRRKGHEAPRRRAARHRRRVYRRARDRGGDERARHRAQPAVLASRRRAARHRCRGHAGRSQADAQGTPDVGPLAVRRRKANFQAATMSDEQSNRSPALAAAEGRRRVDPVRGTAGGDDPRRLRRRGDQSRAPDAAAIRRAPTATQKDGVGLWWKMLGRNKRCVTLYLGDPRGAGDLPLSRSRRRRRDRELPAGHARALGTRR